MIAEGDIEDMITLVCEKHIERVERFRPTTLCPRVYQGIVCDSLVRVTLKTEGLWDADTDSQDEFFANNEPVCCTKLDDELDWPMMEQAIVTRMVRGIQHDPNLPRA